MGKQLKDALLSVGLKPAEPEARNREKTSGGGWKNSKRKSHGHKNESRAKRTYPSDGGPILVSAAKPKEFELQLIELQKTYGARPKVVGIGSHGNGQPDMTELQISVTGKFVPNFLLVTASDSEISRIRPKNDGIRNQLTENPEDHADIILGLDFGTSSVKAVIRDHLADRAYPVVFTNDAGNPFLLPSRVWKSGERYSLDDGIDSLRDLKLSLLECTAPEPVTELDEAIAFLALVIRHCRGWFFDTYGISYRRHQLKWRVNLGLPARSYEDKKLVRLFLRLAWAASNCAANPAAEITSEQIRKYRRLSKDAVDSVNTDTEFTFDDVDVVPEIAAQVFGFVESSRWDWKENPMMMMVDVGAGTVDAAFFSVIKTGNKPKFSFFSNDVQPNGVMNLHRARVKWLRDIFDKSSVADQALKDFLTLTEKPTDRLGPIPESVMDYIGGFHIEIPLNQLDGDKCFIRDHYRPQVIHCILDARKRGIPRQQLQRLPFFLCGGGSRMNIYHSILDQINAAPIDVNVVSQRLPLPEDLVVDNLPTGEFDRLSVAYGLSRQGAGDRPLGEFIRSVDIPDYHPPKILDFQDLYIEQP